MQSHNLHEIFLSKYDFRLIWMMFFSFFFCYKEIQFIYWPWQIYDSSKNIQHPVGWILFIGTVNVLMLSHSHPIMLGAGSVRLWLYLTDIWLVCVLRRFITSLSGKQTISAWKGTRTLWHLSLCCFAFLCFSHRLNTPPITCFSGPWSLLLYIALVCG